LSQTTTRNSLEAIEGTDQWLTAYTNIHTNMETIDAAIAKCKWDATAAPGVGDDSADGYVIGSKWWDITNHKLYECEDNSAGAAVWRQLYPAIVIGTKEVDETDVANGKILKYSSVSGKLEYEVDNDTTDHGSLTGLSDDDHTIYVKNSEYSAKGKILIGTGTGTFSALTVGSNDYILTADSAQSTGVKWAAPAATGTAFWTTVPGTPTRVSDTQFTITDTSNANKYDKVFSKGVILQWTESGTYNTAMISSSSYGSNTVTINIVGDSLTAGFANMKYCIHRAMMKEWIIPGTLATGTSMGRAHFAECAMIKLSVDARVITSGTTNATTFDINDDGTTIITTKPSIASGGYSDLDNVCDSPTTVIAKDSKLTADIDSVSTTPPTEAYITLYWYPEGWRYIT